MRYSIEPRERIYVKGYGFLSFAKIMGKNLSNNVWSKNFRQCQKNLQQMQQKLPQKEQFKKEQKELVI